MSFIDAVRTCFRKYADFTGRAQRSEFWWWYLFTVLGTVLFTSLNSEVADAILWAWLLLAWNLALLLPSLAVAVRRLHDTGASGWLLLVGLIPLLGALILIVSWALPGQPGSNKYGDQP